MGKHDDTSSRIVLAVLVLAVLFSAFWFLKPMSNMPSEEASVENSMSEGNAESTQKLTIEITDGDKVLEREEAPLVDVNAIATPYGGTAYRWKTGDKYMHSVDANLPKARPANAPVEEKKGLRFLEEGYFYEGWIVKAGSPPDVVSTGAMTYNKETGRFSLEFSSDEDYFSHDKVVITLEPDDGNPAPAEHVLDGSF